MVNATFPSHFVILILQRISVGVKLVYRMQHTSILGVDLLFRHFARVENIVDKEEKIASHLQLE